MEDAKNPPSQQMEYSPGKEEQVNGEEWRKEEEQQPALTAAPPPNSGGGGWGGWGFSAFSVLSDLQKAATVAAEEISRNVRFVFSFLLVLFVYVYTQNFWGF